MRSFPKIKRNKTTNAPLHPAEALQHWHPLRRLQKHGICFEKTWTVRPTTTSFSIRLCSQLVGFDFYCFCFPSNDSSRNQHRYMYRACNFPEWEEGFFHDFLFSQKIFSTLWTESLPFIASVLSALLTVGIGLKQVGNKSQPGTSELRSVCVGGRELLEESPVPVRTKGAAVGGRRHTGYTVVRV